MTRKSDLAAFERGMENLIARHPSALVTQPRNKK